MVKQDVCCNDTPTDVSKIHPFTGVGRVVSSVLLPHLSDPIPKEIEDAQELQKFFELGQYVPYSGTFVNSGHSLLKFYEKMYNLSPTHGAVIEKLIKYCFSGAAVFERAKDPEYDIQEEVAKLTAAESLKYRDALKNTVAFEDGILDFHQEILRAFKKFGDSFIEMSYTETEGIAKVFLRTHKNETVLYRNTKPGEARVIEISPIWTKEYRDKYPPRAITMYPVFTNEKGVLRTGFHLKNGKNTWYGKPDSKMADLFKFREAQDALYVIKEAANAYTGKTLLEVEGISAEDDKQAQALGFPSFVARMQHSFSANGEANALNVTSRPMGAKEMGVHQLQPNTNENWYKVTGDINAEQILIAHNATRRFMSFEQSNGLASNPFLDDYSNNMAPVIGALREKVTNFTNKILSIVWMMTNQEDMNAYSVNFRSPIDKMLELYINSLGNATNNSSGGSTL